MLCNICTKQSEKRGIQDLVHEQHTTLNRKPIKTSMFFSSQHATANITVARKRKKMRPAMKTRREARARLHSEWLSKYFLSPWYICFCISRGGIWTKSGWVKSRYNITAFTLISPSVLFPSGILTKILACACASNPLWLINMGSSKHYHQIAWTRVPRSSFTYSGSTDTKHWGRVACWDVGVYLQVFLTLVIDRLLFSLRLQPLYSEAPAPTGYKAG
jgi:hypothetical protein